MSLGKQLLIAFSPTSTEGNPLNLSIFLAGCSILFFFCGGIWMRIGFIVWLSH